MKQYTLNRKTYKDVKRMDHQQMDAFCKNLYKAGHADGMKDIAEGKGVHREMESEGKRPFQESLLFVFYGQGSCSISTL